MACFVIAEAGVNHNGSLELALKLVDIAAEAGADAIKFQTFDAKSLVVSGAKKAEYQKAGTPEGDQLSMLQRLELSHDDHKQLLQRCEEKKIEFMSTAFDEQSANFLCDLGVQRIKIPSGEINNTPFIKFLANKGLPLVMSTGMATMDDIALALEAIQVGSGKSLEQLIAQDLLTVLHCTSNYPAAPEEINLKAMKTIENKFNVPVGYSDHSEGTEVAIAAVALNARVIEKHFTVSRHLPGPDHQASLEPDELNTMIRQIRLTETILGDGVKAPTESELKVRKVARKSLHVTRDLSAGEVLQASDVAIIRPNDGMSPSELEHVIGQQLNVALSAGSAITSECLAK